MKYKQLLITGLSLCILGLGVSSAQAAPKGYFYSWNDNHWDTLDFKPYVAPYNQTHRPVQRQNPHQYDSKTNVGDVIAKFRAGKMLHKFYIDEDTGLSIAEMGPYFYDLSQSDKHKFLATLDKVYNVTNSDQRVMFLRDWNTRKDIGQYGVNGLMLF